MSSIKFSLIILFLIELPTFQCFLFGGLGGGESKGCCCPQPCAPPPIPCPPSPCCCCCCNPCGGPPPPPAPVPISGPVCGGLLKFKFNF
jgi:hypothetical protein